MVSFAIERTKLLLVGEDGKERKRLETWLQASGYQVYVVESGVEAIALLKHHPIHLVITDMHLPALSGMNLLPLVKQLDARIEVIILSSSCTVDEALWALRAQAFDLILKPIQDLLQLNLVIEKASLSRNACHHDPASASAVGDAMPPAKDLTQREGQVLALLALGLENKAIAERLCLGEKTVRNLLSAIYSKLGVESRTQAVIQYQRWGQAWDSQAPIPIANWRSQPRTLDS